MQRRDDSRGGADCSPVGRLYDVSGMPALTLCRDETTVEVFRADTESVVLDFSESCARERVAKEAVAELPYVSVLIPARNEAGNLCALLQEVRAALAGEHYEVIVVDDGSSDNSIAELLALKPGFAQLHVLHHAHALGQSTSIYHAAHAARGRWLATLDGDGQNDPADLPAMLARVRGSEGRVDGIKLVAGHRVSRRDTASKRWASRFANGLRRRLLRDGVPDTGCGIKLIERELFLRLPYFDHMHRFIPALAQRHNARMVVHAVNHRSRQAGVSKYGNIDRALAGVVDLLGVWWLIRRTRLDAAANELEG